MASVTEAQSILQHAAVPHAGEHTSVTTPAVTSMRDSRVPSIDVLRGFVMVLMALDHTRDFFNAPLVAGPSHLSYAVFSLGGSLIFAHRPLCFSPA